MNFRLNPYAFHNLNPSSGLSYRNFKIDSFEVYAN